MVTLCLCGDLTTRCVMFMTNDTVVDVLCRIYVSGEGEWISDRASGGGDGDIGM